MARVLEELIDERELLDFSQNFSVVRNYMGSSLFPDRKTQYVEAEYTRLARNGNLPAAAMVHAFDTEAHIGERIPFEHVTAEQLLIKEKINQTESIRRITRGMKMDGVKNYVFDDIARMAERVVTRVELAKMQALTTGKLTISENGIDGLVVDYGVPTENSVTTDWTDTTNADIIGDLKEWRKIARDNGVQPNLVITTEKVVDLMMANATIQKAIFGTAGAGILPTIDQINTLLRSHVGVTITTNEERYAVYGKGTDGVTSITQARFFPEDTLVMVSTGADGSLGTGLWGVTPEEEAQGDPFDSKREQQYVTVTQKADWDPVCVWTKASGVFLPVLPNPYGHVIANVATTQTHGTGGSDDSDLEG